jgi:hypothetical protein
LFAVVLLVLMLLLFLTLLSGFTVIFVSDSIELKEEAYETKERE